MRRVPDIIRDHWEAALFAASFSADFLFWIGNTYLDDSGRDSPASLNSTGDM